MERSYYALACLLPILCYAVEAKQPVAAPPTGLSPATLRKVHELSVPWNKPDTPGYALAIIRNGKIIYRHGYGMADLEHRVAISPSTVFHVASMSKQFTAFAIHLLAQEGKLSLDDDIRKYLPELNDFGKTITIRHLLHHTSGLRDQWNLLVLAGWRFDDVITEDDILNLVWRQKSLNFMPGDEFLYCNTGYTLLGVIVKRVSGQSLSTFTRQRIFDPLGMHHTHFHDDYGTLVPGRAYSYVKQDDDKYKYVALSYSNTGATSLFTSVEDLALWDQNFYDARVGGKELIARMQEPGVLNADIEISYASGLDVSRYRGLRAVEHSGGDAGYRTDILRFPDQRFSVVILSNAGDANPALLAHEVADIFLEKLMTPAPAGAPKTPAKKPTAIKIDPTTLDALVGEYEVRPGRTITYTKGHDELMAQTTGEGKLSLYPTGERTFTYKLVDASITFEEPGQDGVVTAAVHHQYSQEFRLKRIKRVPLSAAELKERAGEFYSDELHVLYTVAAKDGRLVLHYPRGEFELQRGVDTDSFAAEFPIGSLHYSCSLRSGCDGFSISDGRVRNLRFIRAQEEYAVANIDTSTWNGLTGYYQVSPRMIDTVARDGSHLFSQLTGGLRYEMFPSSDHDYFFAAIDERVSFPTSPQGEAAGLVLHLNGYDMTGQRVDEATAKATEDFPRRRIAEDTPTPGSEAALRRVIEERRSQPDYDRMAPAVAQGVRQSLSTVQSELAALGEEKSLEFECVGSGGEDIYAVHFENGDAEWHILLAEDGMIHLLQHSRFKEATRLPLGQRETLRSGPGTTATTIEFWNKTDETLKVYWIDPNGEFKSYGTVNRHQIKTLRTFVSHLWAVGKDEQHPLGLFNASPGLTIGTIN